MELVNREETYNKTFGRQPNVGVINPLAAKQPQTATTQPPQKKTSTSKLPPLDKVMDSQTSLNFTATGGAQSMLFRSTSQSKTKR